MSPELEHIPVLAKEVLEYLDPEPEKIYIDGTLGGAGHSKLILEKLKTGKLFSFDQDIEVIDRLEAEAQKSENWTLVHSNFSELADYCLENNLKIDGGILLDLGLSSIQLDDPERGFSFNIEAPLDMRLNPEAELTAEKVINSYQEKAIADILYHYAEERKSRQIAKAIVQNRPIKNCKELADLIKSTYARNYKGSFKVHPATKTFQALRIYINKELEVLEKILESAPEIMSPGARMVIISFHSLEDRIVKNAFKQDHWQILTKKPITASEEEITKNPRSRSAKLRAAVIPENY